MRAGWLVALCAVLVSGSACEQPAEPEVQDDACAGAASTTEVATVLRARGAVVEEGECEVLSLFSVPGRVLVVNGAALTVYGFESEGAASAEVPELARSLIHWVAPARLYRRGSSLVLYVGRNDELLTLLEQTFGTPVGGVG